MMKKLLLILLCLPMIGLGQPYLDFTSTWIVYSSTAPPGPFTSSTTEFYISPLIAMINGNNYMEVYSTTNTTTLNPGVPPIFTTSNGGPSYLREDGFKWYVYNQTTGLDELFCDFSLNVGDDIGSFYSGPVPAPVITSITNVTLFGSTVRQQFHLDAGNGFIEGVGNLAGLFAGYGYGPIEEGSSLSCYMQNNQNWGLFPGSSIDSLCDLTISSVNTNIVDANKELLKVTDLLGRETNGTKNQPLFYIYDDGTVEKRIMVE